MKKIIKQILIVGSIFAFLLALSGCGQKGALYLPQKNSAKKTNSGFYAGGGLGATQRR